MGAKQEDRWLLVRAKQAELARVGAQVALATTGPGETQRAAWDGVMRALTPATEPGGEAILVPGPAVDWLRSVPHECDGRAEVDRLKAELANLVNERDDARSSRDLAEEKLRTSYRLSEPISSLTEPEVRALLDEVRKAEAERDRLRAIFLGEDPIACEKTAREIVGPCTVPLGCCGKCHDKGRAILRAVGRAVGVVAEGE
jgi:hypothetical protein